MLIVGVRVNGELICLCALYAKGVNNFKCVASALTVLPLVCIGASSAVCLNFKGAGRCVALCFNAYGLLFDINTCYFTINGIVAVLVFVFFVFVYGTYYNRFVLFCDFNFFRIC